MFIERLTFRFDITLICLAIKLVFLSIQNWKNGEENKTQEVESVKESAIRQLQEKVGNKLRLDFYLQMQEYYQRESLLRELQVRFKV